MLDLIETEKHFVQPHIRVGGAAVDCTMGNGGDTLWLSRAVGPQGHVFSFDIQEAAVESTSARLKAEGVADNCTLILASHAEIKKYVTAQPCAVLFNLGYLPRGDHHITTLRPSTKAAVEGAMELLAPDGVILVAVYPGHEEGRLEGEMLDEMFSALDRRVWGVTKVRIINSPTSPFFYVLENQPEPKIAASK